MEDTFVGTFWGADDMASSARLSRTIVGLELTVDRDGQPIRAVVTREALEALSNATLEGPDAILQSYREHKGRIEAAVLERYAVTKQEPVALHMTGSLTTPPRAIGPRSRRRTWST